MQIISRILKPGIFLYECIKLMVLSTVISRTLTDTFGFQLVLLPWVVLAAPSALFPLMALFLWLDSLRYKPYLSLYMAGKCIGIFLLLIWSMVLRRVILAGDLSGGLFELIFLAGDFFAIAAVLFTYRNEKTTEDS
jgi:hypothetical protein